MSNTNNSNAPRSSRASRKRARAAGNAPPQAAQPARKKRRARNTKRNAKRGRDAAARAGNPPQEPAVVGFFAPVAEGTKMSGHKPVFIRMSHSEQRIMHRELVSKVVTPGNGLFTILAAIALNPGLQASFPWLSNEAAGWESYRFNKLRLIWVPSMGTQVAGDILIAPDYDAADAAPTGEAAMASYSDSEEANIWARFECVCEPDLLNGEMRRKFIRLGALAPNLDVKTYDSGIMFVASTDDAINNTGKLWIEYDVTLFNPHVPPGGFQAAGWIGTGTGPAAATPFGTIPTSGGTLALSASATNVLTIGNVQPGQEINVSFATAGTVITACSQGTPVGMTAKIQFQSCINAAATDAACVGTYVVTALNPTITVTVTATTVGQSQAVVTVLAPLTTGTQGFGL